MLFRSENGTIGMITGKKVFIISPKGNKDVYSEQHGSVDAIRITEDMSIFEFCGMEVLKHKFIGGIQFKTYEERLEILDHVKKYATRYFD